MRYNYLFFLATIPFNYANIIKKKAGEPLFSSHRRKNR